MLPLYITKYLQTRAIHGPWQITGSPANDFRGAVVIPALAESGYLFATLRSLAANPVEQLARILVLVVVNHREDSPAADKSDNYQTLERLAAGHPELGPLRLGWVDAASPGLEMPARGGGVGLARKIGLDLALSRLDFTGQSPLLVSLDADTLTEPSYLPALERHFRHSSCGGAVIPFCHRPGASPAEQGAIDHYELFLRSYVLGLTLAGSPYAFHSVGSAMACTAFAYVRAGGMNRRPAAEDFYFLQQLQRTSGVEKLRGTLVFPSARPSHRVPFGTGRAITRTITENVGAVMYYRPECFRILGAWLKLITMNPEREAGAIMADGEAISPHLAGYLEREGFKGVWEKLQSNHRGAGALCLAFHGWFDGLKSMKLIHSLSAGPYPRCEPEEAVLPLLGWAGLERASGVIEKLALLRSIQNQESRRLPPAAGRGFP
jgi:hypothetical protein